MNRFNCKIKFLNEDTGSEESLTICIEADTYGVAEQIATAWCEDMLSGTWRIESVVKTQIKEVIETDDDQYYFLAKYEFGLEVKPEKSNVLTTEKDIHMAIVKVSNHIESFCSAPFITEIKKQEIKHFIVWNEGKALINFQDEEELLEELNFEL